MKEKIKELLGLNLPATVVSSAVGCTPQYVSELMSEEEFSREVQELRIASLSKAASRDNKYNTIEDALLTKLEEKLQSGLMFTSSGELLRAIRTVNSAVRRGSPVEHQNQFAQSNVVSLQLPENAEFVARFVVNGSNQVVEIAGRPAATMNAKGVNAKLEEMHKRRREAVEVEQKDKSAAVARVEGLTRLVQLSSLPVRDLAATIAEEL